MTKYFLFFLIGISVCPLSAGETMMNGHDLKRFSDFKSWHFVTTRFRADTGELRFVYANNLAWEGLEKKSHQYKKGSVFAKVGFESVADPNFFSSKMAGRLIRYQFMEKGAQRGEYAGWTYSAFDAQGKALFEDEKATTKACHACHTMVKEKDYIFTHRFDDYLPVNKINANKVGKLVNCPRTDLNEGLLKMIPHLTGPFLCLQSDLLKTDFAGTLNELRPWLIKKAIESKQPVVAQDNTKSLYVLVMKQEGAGNSCLHMGTQAVPVLVISRSLNKPNSPVYAINDTNSARTESICFDQ